MNNLKQEILTHALDIQVTSEEGLIYMDSVIESVKKNTDDELSYRFIKYIENYDTLGSALDPEYDRERFEIMREKFAHARNDAKFRAIFLRELRFLT